MPMRDFTKEPARGSASLGDALNVIYGEVERQTRRGRAQRMVKEAEGQPGATVTQTLNEAGEITPSVTTKNATAEEARLGKYQDLLGELYTKQQAAGDQDATYRIVPSEKGYGVERVEPGKTLAALAQDRAIRMTGGLLEGEKQEDYEARLEKNLAVARRQLGDKNMAAAPGAAPQAKKSGLLELMGQGAQMTPLGQMLKLLVSRFVKPGAANRATRATTAPETGVQAAEYDPQATYEVGQQVLVNGVLHEVTGLDKDGTPLVDPVP